MKMMFYSDFRHNEDVLEFLTYFETELATLPHLKGSQECEYFYLYLHSGWDAEE